MSFILDALRKSENERQRNQAPDMATAQAQNSRKGSSVWIPLVALLVGINLSLIIVMWILSGPDNSADTAMNSPATALSTPVENITSSVPATNNPSNRRLAEELTPATESAVTFPQDNVAALPDIPPSTDMNNTVDHLPTLAELMFNNSISLPPLHLDIHVYSSDPAERFVFINMSRYNEGEILGEGPRVITINKSGVVLRHQGQEFLVTRE